MEEKRDKRESNCGNKGTDQNIGHTLADAGFGFVRKIPENRQQNEGSQIVTGHDDAHDPLDIQDLGGITGFEFRRRHVVNISRENIRQEGRTPGIVDLPKKQNAEKCKADQSGALVVQL